jgi:tRNA (cmo5U34)-methyltransferase
VAEVGDGIEVTSGVWSFAGPTARAFGKHVERSIPFYKECHELIVDLADEIAPARSRCYDLGCSHGVLIERLAERLGPRGVELIGVDREPAMVELARERCGRFPSVTLLTESLQDLEFEPADLIISFYTLQFVPIRERHELAQRLHKALEPGGALILFEKVLASGGRGQETMSNAYREWKRRRGYNDEEIAAKARSLRGVLQPQSSADNQLMLERAGFGEIVQVYRWMGWEGLLAWA